MPDVAMKCLAMKLQLKSSPRYMLYGNEVQQPGREGRRSVTTVLSKYPKTRPRVMKAGCAWGKGKTNMQNLFPTIQCQPHMCMVGRRVGGRESRNMVGKACHGGGSIGRYGNSAMGWVGSQYGSHCTHFHMSHPHNALLCVSCPQNVPLSKKTACMSQKRMYTQKWQGEGNERWWW